MVALDVQLYGDVGAVSPFCFQSITISYGQCLNSIPVLLRTPLADYQRSNFVQAAKRSKPQSSTRVKDVAMAELT